jgi:release factor glutamine methyltransferase
MSELTLKEVLSSSVQYLAEAGISTARQDAEILISHALGLSRVDLYLDFYRTLTPQEHQAVEEFIRKRGQRYPLQYLTGEVVFRGLILRMEPGVFIPRPETELLVECAVEILGSSELRSSMVRRDSFPPSVVNADRLAGSESPVILDVGTGCGAIALSLAREVKDCAVYGLDISAQAIDLAHFNARKLGLEERITFLVGDFVQITPSELRGKVDLVASNPPYIKKSDIAHLEPEVRDYETAAIDGGRDGLAFFRRLLPFAQEFLAPGGQLLLEIGEGQVQEIVHLAEQSSFKLVGIHQDLGGIDRIIQLGKRVL